MPLPANIISLLIYRVYAAYVLLLAISKPPSQHKFFILLSLAHQCITHHCNDDDETVSSVHRILRHVTAAIHHSITCLTAVVLEPWIRSTAF